MAYKQNAQNYRDYFHPPSVAGGQPLFSVALFFVNLGAGSSVRLNPKALEKEMEALSVDFISRVI